MNSLQRAEIAIFSAKLVLPLFEAAYLGNDKPRKAIESAELILSSNTCRDVAAHNAFQAMLTHISAHHDDIASKFMNPIISSAHAAAHVAFEAAETAIAVHDKSDTFAGAVSAIDYAIKASPALESVIADEANRILG